MTGGDVIELYLDVYRYSQTAYDAVTARSSKPAMAKSSMAGWEDGIEKRAGLCPPLSKV